ncbi:MAG TPA: response regulator [Candidatus Angelobacter sp.]|nr:response regulator [Candidatus Angelobacter sp.]
MQKMKILIAEDDTLTLTLLERLLGGWGYEVIAVHDGESARRVLLAGGIHICILDWEMPWLNGKDLCEWIHSANLTKEPYVILLTGRGKPQHICDGFAAGADDYITKPFERDDLRYRLADLALRVMRFEALGETMTNIDPIDMYRLDLSRFSKVLALPV